MSTISERIFDDETEMAENPVCEVGVLPFWLNHAIDLFFTYPTTLLTDVILGKPFDSPHWGRNSDDTFWETGEIDPDSRKTSAKSV